MNLASPAYAASKCLYRIAMRCRRLLPKQKCKTFGVSDAHLQSRIGRILVINLQRQPARWAEMEKELRHVRNSSGAELWSLAERYPAVDAIQFEHEPVRDADIDPTYTLAEQLFVEPQPLVLPDRLELESPITMSRAEVAVARSHINVWREVAKSSNAYVLVLEDDVLFHSGFAAHLDQAWRELDANDDRNGNFDILYLSYEEVKHGAPKTFLSSNVFRPVRGLWHLSGYVISRKGAKKLLELLPCRGPVDLWINHKFGVLDVRATRRSIITQRRDIASSNSYSILPALTRIGAITSESAALFHVRPTERPVFAFGSKGSGLSSLAMALSMLGYRCCSDLQTLPDPEVDMLLAARGHRVFDAYVNIGSLAGQIPTLRERYPYAKFFVTASKTECRDESIVQILDDLEGTDTRALHLETSNKWKVVCEHLRCSPPPCSFPESAELGQRQVVRKTTEAAAASSWVLPKRDKSPWVIEPRQRWCGIHVASVEGGGSVETDPVTVRDDFEFLNRQNWILREDTFTDNLALFRPSNIEVHSSQGAALSIRRESLGVREYSAGSLTSHDQYLFGRFEVLMKASNVPGVVTGFFLHRDSPRQEIDIEIAGNRTDRLLANVFYNPGSEGSRFDYGYRGSPTYIELGFDASESYHRFAIEWGSCEIRWFVDNRLVHRRVLWDPTPIPHLPMALHVNIWPSRSTAFAGRFANRRVPTATFVRMIELEANRQPKSLPL
jgi:GR25 family glycosyltransferase involved in LPS biosynthesis